MRPSGVLLCSLLVVGVCLTVTNASAAVTEAGQAQHRQAVVLGTGIKPSVSRAAALAATSGDDLISTATLHRSSSRSSRSSGGNMRLAAATALDTSSKRTRAAASSKAAAAVKSEAEAEVEQWDDREAAADVDVTLEDDAEDTAMSVLADAGSEDGVEAAAAAAAAVGSGQQDEEEVEVIEEEVIILDGETGEVLQRDVHLSEAQAPTALPATTAAAATTAVEELQELDSPTNADAEAAAAAAELDSLPDDIMSQEAFELQQAANAAPAFMTKAKTAAAAAAASVASALRIRRPQGGIKAAVQNAKSYITGSAAAQSAMQQTPVSIAALASSSSGAPEATNPQHKYGSNPMSVSAKVQRQATHDARHAAKLSAAGSAAAAKAQGPKGQHAPSLGTVGMDRSVLKRVAHALGVKPKVMQDQAASAMEQHRQLVKLAEQAREAQAALQQQQQQQQQGSAGAKTPSKGALQHAVPPSSPKQDYADDEEVQTSSCFKPLLQPPFFDRQHARSLNNAYVAMLLARYTYPTAFGINVNTNASQLTYQELFRRKWVALGAKPGTIQFQDAGGGTRIKRILNAQKPEAHAIVLGTSTDVWIAYRGLTSVDSALTSDMRHSPTEAVFGSKKVEVHSGFYSGFRAIWPQVMMAVKAAIMQTAEPTEAKIYITGHSLGGAHALFTAMKLSEMKLKNIGGVYLFGTPRIGHSEFLDLFSDSGLEPVTSHWWNELDLVPTFGTAGPWKRSYYQSLPQGTLYRIWGGQCRHASTATAQACPLGPHRCRKSIQDHRAFSYVAKLQACVLQQASIAASSCMTSKVMSSM